MNIKKLMPTDAESRGLNDGMEKGVCDALQKKYLKKLMFCIFEKVDGPMIEKYAFSFSYSDSDSQHVTMNFKNKKHGGTFNSTADITPNQKKRSSACKMVHTLLKVMRTTLDEMPAERTIVMKLLYNDDVTPPDYEPPFFRGCTDEEAQYVWTKNPRRTKNVNSKRLVLTLKVKSVLDPCEDENDDMQDSEISQKQENQFIVAPVEKQDDDDDGEVDEDNTQDPVENEQQLERVKDWINSRHLDTLELTDILANIPDISKVLSEEIMDQLVKEGILSKTGKDTYIKKKDKELESMADPMRKEVSVVRKKIDSVNKELKPSGSTVQKKDIDHRPNIFWWDYENMEIPTELDHDVALDRIIKKMRDSGLYGPVEFKIVVGYLDSNVPKLSKMDNIEISHANTCDRPKRNTRKNQAADVHLKKEIEFWLLENTEAHNVIFISLDNGFKSVLQLFKGTHHRVILVRSGREGVQNADGENADGENADGRLIWDWRESLGLPKDRVYKNPNAKREADRKRARSQAKKESNSKKAKQDRSAAVAKAKDEREPIPKSISQVGNGVQIDIDVEIHNQHVSIISVENDSVRVAAPKVDGEVLLEIGRRVGKSKKEISVQKVDGSKLTVLVQNITAREVYWKLVHGSSKF